MLSCCRLLRWILSWSQDLLLLAAMNITSNASDIQDIGYGVEQPSLVTKDILIIVFMFLLWGYSLILTYRAWYKILYSDGEDGTNMWRYLMDVIKSKSKDSDLKANFFWNE